MDQKEIAVKAAQQFQTPEGKIVDVIYATSDGQMFYTPEEASEVASGLLNKTVMPFYKDAEVRKLARKYTVLERMVLVTDFIKRHKAKKTTPLYPDYTELAIKYKMAPVTDEVFKFVFSQVYTTRKVQYTGQKDSIYLHDKGIVTAHFLRRYEQGQVWQYMDRLVFTCPTNTELLSISYFDVFSPLLGTDPEKQKV